MDQFVNFIKEYWQFIAPALVLVLEILLLIIKRKKPEVLSSGVFSLIADKISEAEKFYGSGHGDEKLGFVIQAVSSYYPKTSVDSIKLMVEYLLELPQKKGD